MSERRIETYEEFWPFYVREHSNPTSRKLHFVGTSGSIGFVLAALIRRKPIHVLHALLSGYGGAWVGHFFFQKNKPATFKYPLWSLYSDFRMYGKIVTGQMDAEVERALAEEAARNAEGSAQADGGASHESHGSAANGPGAAPAEVRPEDLN